MSAHTVTAGFLVAHQGGWDEMLFVILPLLVFAVLLAVARRRVDIDDDATDDEIDGT